MMVLVFFSIFNGNENLCIIYNIDKSTATISLDTTIHKSFQSFFDFRKQELLDMHETNVTNNYDYVGITQILNIDIL